MKMIRPILLSGLLAAGLQAESGYDAWLRYERVPGDVPVPTVVTIMHDSEVLRSARAELIRGLQGMTGSILRSAIGAPRENAIILGTFAEAGVNASLAEDGFVLRRVGVGHI